MEKLFFAGLMVVRVTLAAVPTASAVATLRASFSAHHRDSDLSEEH